MAAWRLEQILPAVVRPRFPLALWARSRPCAGCLQFSWGSPRMAGSTCRRPYHLGSCCCTSVRRRVGAIGSHSRGGGRACGGRWSAALRRAGAAREHYRAPECIGRGSMLDGHLAADIRERLSRSRRACSQRGRGADSDVPARIEARGESRTEQYRDGSTLRLHATSRSRGDMREHVQGSDG